MTKKQTKQEEPKAMRDSKTIQAELDEAKESLQQLERESVDLNLRYNALRLSILAEELIEAIEAEKQADTPEGDN